MSQLKDNLEMIQQKAKERTVRTQTIEYDLETLVKKISKGIIKLSPEYQRNHRWTDEVSSRLIESLILNIPIPIIYLSQDIDVDDEASNDEARYSVIDGQQRLTAINNFFQNSYHLIGLEVLSELNGCFHKDLPPFLIRRLEERAIRCLRIDSTIDTQVKYDIFERLNSGAVKLEAQELRNATCQGPFRDLIKKLSKDPDFIATAHLITGNQKPSVRVQKMEDEELVLRYFSICYQDGYKDYKGQFKKFLTTKMESFNILPPAEFINMENNFKETIHHILKDYGVSPFAKYRFNPDDSSFEQMSPFNVAVFDAVVYAFSKLSPSSTQSYDTFKTLFADKDFFDSIEGSTNDVAKLNNRITLAMSVIK